MSKPGSRSTRRLSRPNPNKPATPEAALPPEGRGPAGDWGALLRSRTAAMLAGFGLFLAVIGGYAGPRWPAVISILVTDGALAGAWVLSAALLGSCLVPLFLGPPEKGPPAEKVSPVLRFVTAAALGLGVYSLLTLGLGLLGWLNRGTVVALPLVSAAAGAVRRRARAGDSPTIAGGIPAIGARIRGRRAEAWLRAPAGWHWLWLGAAPLLAIVVLGDSLTPGLLWKPDDPHPYDVLEYHLQLPREWYEAGRITPLRHNVFSFFPLNAEMHSLCAMHLRGGPWAGMYLAQYLCGFHMVLATLAVYGAAKSAVPRPAPATPAPLGPGTARPQSANGALLEINPASSPLSAIMAALAFVGVPWVPMLAATAYDESALLLYATLSIGWALRALCASRRRPRLMALAGAFAGLAGGVKYTAIPLVLLGVPACAFLVEVMRRRRHGRSADAEARGGAVVPADGTAHPVADAPPAPVAFLGSCAVFGLVGLLFVSPWLVRNLAWSGNPVFPLGARLLGRGHFSELQVERFERAHSPPQSQRPPLARLAAAWRETVGHWQYGYALWIVALLAGGAAVARPVRRPPARPVPPAPPYDRRLVFLGAMFLLTFVVWIGFTHLISRFFILAVPVVALFVGSVDWRRLNLVAPLSAAILLLAGAFVGWFGGASTGTRRLLEDPMTWAQSGLFGMTDVAPLVADDLVPIETGPGRVALIGDAQPFLHPVPMARLSYRTVFDVDAESAGPGVDGLAFANPWLPPDERGPRPDRTIIIYRNEVERLARTYRSPDLPEPLKAQQRREEAAARREGRWATDHVYEKW